MKAIQSILDTIEDTETTYQMVEEFFGTLRADQVYFSITHPQY